MLLVIFILKSWRLLNLFCFTLKVKLKRTFLIIYIIGCLVIWYKRSESATTIELHLTLTKLVPTLSQNPWFVEKKNTVPVHLEHDDLDFNICTWVPLTSRNLSRAEGTNWRAEMDHRLEELRALRILRRNCGNQKTGHYLKFWIFLNISEMLMFLTEDQTF